MKKECSFLIALTILISGLSCTSCSEANETFTTTQEEKKIESIQVNICDFIGSENITRTVVNINDKGASFNWGENDTIGIFPTNGYQVAFPMSLGTGTQTAEFDGNDWTLKASKKYAAYYPFNYENRSYKNVAISYLGQKQKGHGNTAHLGMYDYMAAELATPTEGNVVFNFKHLGALIQWKLTMPEGGKFTKLTLRCEDRVFTQTGVLDMSQNTMAIMSEQKHKRISMDLENVETDPKGQIVLYMMMAPTDLSEKEYSVIITNENGDMKAAHLKGKKIEVGKAYSISAEDFEYYEEDMLETMNAPLQLANGTNDTISLRYKTNQPLTYTISDEAKDWIYPIDSRVITEENMQFNIKENKSGDNREGKITLTSLNEDLSITYTILQGRAGSYAVTKEKGCNPPYGFIYCNYPAASSQHGLYALTDNKLDNYFEVEAQSFEITWECLEPFHVSKVGYGLSGGKHQIGMASFHVSDDEINWKSNGKTIGISPTYNVRMLYLGPYNYYNKFYKLVVNSNNGASTTQIPEFVLK